jgi:glycosyltransferase involved in cell wall biosynthesis
MQKKIKKFFYWSPFFGNVGTVKSVLQSAISVKKFSREKVEVTILNCFSEWDFCREIIKNNFLSIINLQEEIVINTDIYGYFKSRFLNLFFFFILYKKLKRIIYREQPDYLIVHLLTYIPLILFFFNKFNTKLYLKISGRPKLNFYRRFLWKFCSRKISKVFCPTIETLEYLAKNKIFSKELLCYLPDPIINISEINKLKKEKNNIIQDTKCPFFLSVGRLTRQKNHFFLIEAFKKSLPNENLVILGSGELKNILIKKILDSRLQNQISLIGYQKNVFNFLINAKALIITSEWEDPGFVMIEAASLNIPIISSNCSSGPKEFLENNSSGFLYHNKSLKDFDLAIKLFLTADVTEIYKKLVNAKKKARFYTKFHHFRILNRFIN